MKLDKTLMLISLFLFINCKSKNHNKLDKNKTVIQIENKEDFSLLQSKLPIGKKELIKEKLDNEYINSVKLFNYYDTINGEPSLYFKPIKNLKYNSFYKPTSSDSRNEEDVFFLRTNDTYNYFKLTKVLPKKNNYSILIFDGLSSALDYDGNPINISRKDIVILNSSLKIVDEMNIYFSYTDGIISRTKLFFIDKDYNIRIRYFNEGEENNFNYSKISQYLITSEGIIIKK